MNKDIVKGKWNEMKGKVKQEWADMTDDDVTRINGSYDELHGVLQQKMGYDKDRAEKAIDTFIQKNGWDK